MRFLVIFFLIIQGLSAQNLVRKSVIDPEIKTIHIDAKYFFELQLKTVKANEMVLQATIDGEYKKGLVLTMERQGHTLVVASDFQPVFEKPNDKLSAHKVISIAMKVYLPEGKTVRVYGRDCNISASGNYRKLQVSLNDGNCQLKNISESVGVKTQSGDIDVWLSAGKVKAISKYGQVQIDELPTNDTHYDLASITGNISIKKTE